MDSAPAAGGSLCVLGAGNCNDLDLGSLHSRFGEIHLVDLDRAALEAAVARQQVPDVSWIRLHAPHDLTGVIDELTHGSSADALKERIRAFRLPLQGSPFDVVLSAGMLSQMFQSFADARLRADETVGLVVEARRQHFQLLLDLTRAGGACVLVTDVVSTATAPDLAALREDQLEARLGELIEARNFFTGTNPTAIWNLLAQDLELVARIEHRTFHAPWIWSITKSHAFLTCALTLRKHRRGPVASSR
jgi:hypothetical protein